MKGRCYFCGTIHIAPVKDKEELGRLAAPIGGTWPATPRAMEIHFFKHVRRRTPTEEAAHRLWE